MAAARETVMTPKGLEELKVKIEHLRTALVTALACGLCATATPGSARADDTRLLPDVFAAQRDPACRVVS